MFDVSWGELLIVAAVALVVIGPKDLPGALRSLGQMTAKLRRMAGEFQNQFQEAMREADLDAIRKDVAAVGDAAQNLNPIKAIQDEIKGAIDARPPEPKALPSAAAASTVAASAAIGSAEAEERHAGADRAQLELATVPAVPDARDIMAEAVAGPPMELAAVDDREPRTGQEQARAKPPERKPDAA